MSTKLNADVLLHIEPYLSPTDAVSLARVNKGIWLDSGLLLRRKCVGVFGKIDNLEQVGLQIVARLLDCAEKQPDARLNHNNYKAPNNLLERWKWLVGVENSLDKKVQANYDSKIGLLENAQAISILQLKNQMQGFWHMDRQIKDYAQFKSDEQTRANTGLINKIFFACLKFYFHCFYNSAVPLKIGKKLESRSEETFAKIGNFELNNKHYDVVAFHGFCDENSGKANYADETRNKFRSKFYGKTHIGIFKKEETPSLKGLGHYSSNPSFSIMIGREKVDGNSYPKISSEECSDHDTTIVSNRKRHLCVDNSLEYRSQPRKINIQGSERLLDQKLTQIMIEMTVQNKSILSLKVGSNNNDLPVLAAGGFKSHLSKQMMQELHTFRSIEGNELYPQYDDYGHIETTFSAQDFIKANVHYSRADPESWSDIIKREPILKPKSAILPEYWEIKPNIAEE